MASSYVDLVLHYWETYRNIRLPKTSWADYVDDDGKPNKTTFIQVPDSSQNYQKTKTT